MKSVEQYACWALVAWACLMCYVSHVGWTVGPGCSLLDRVGYSLCHINFWHLLANLWAGWVIAHSSFRDSPWRWVTSWAVAFSVPAACGPAMGLSGVLYALMGMLSWQAAKPKQFHMWVLAFMALGLFFPTKVGTLLHLYCYAIGMLAECSIQRIREAIHWRQK